MSPGRAVWVKVRASEAERADAAAAGRLCAAHEPLARVPVVERRSAVVTARVSAAEVERERTRQVERIGHNLVVYAPLSP